MSPVYTRSQRSAHLWPGKAGSTARNRPELLKGPSGLVSGALMGCDDLAQQH